MGWQGSGLAGVAVLLALVLGVSACTHSDTSSHHQQLEDKIARLQDELQAERQRRQKVLEKLERDGKTDQQARAAAHAQPARDTRPEQQSQSEHKSRTACRDCGTVTTIEPIRRNASHGSGLGAIGGGAAGAAIGHQIGHGTGRRVAEAAGVLGGARMGNTVEKNVRKETVYRVHVDMDNGQTRVVTVGSARELARGRRVRVHGNSLAVIR